MTELKDWLNSINTGKNNLIDEDIDLEKKYPSYIVNRCLSGHIDAVMFANEMNKHPNLAKKLQYDFFLNSLRKKKRYSPWLRKEQIENLELVKKYYGYSNEKAKQVLNILTREQLSFIRDRLETGGKR
jgi:hypothetical protein